MFATVFVNDKSFTVAAMTPSDCLELLEEKVGSRLTYRPADGVIFADMPHRPIGLIYRERY